MINIIKIIQGNRNRVTRHKYPGIMISIIIICKVVKNIRKRLLSATIVLYATGPKEETTNQDLIFTASHL